MSCHDDLLAGREADSRSAGMAARCDRRHREPSVNLEMLQVCTCQLLKVQLSCRTATTRPIGCPSAWGAKHGIDRSHPMTVTTLLPEPSAVYPDAADAADPCDVEPASGFLFGPATAGLFE